MKIERKNISPSGLINLAFVFSRQERPLQVGISSTSSTFFEKGRKNSENLFPIPDLDRGLPDRVQARADEEGVVVVDGRFRSGKVDRIRKVLLILPRLCYPVTLSGQLRCHLVKYFYSKNISNFFFFQNFFPNFFFHSISNLFFCWSCCRIWECDNVV